MKSIMQTVKRALLFAAVLVLCGTANAQKANPLTGLWQYVEEVVKPDGQKAYIGKQIYKTITDDNKYNVMLGVNIPLKDAGSEKTEMSTLTFITQQGEIEMKENNTYLEYINNHFLDKSLNNTISYLRFRFNEKNPNILYVEYNLNGTDDAGWVSEVWLRVVPYGSR